MERKIERVPRRLSRGSWRLPRITVGTVVRLLVASLVVGALMAWLDITPDQVVRYVGETVGSVAHNVMANLNSAIKYVLLGAVVVVPVWLIATLWKSFGRR